MNNTRRCFVSLFYISMFSSPSIQNVPRNSEKTYLHNVSSCPRTVEDFLNASNRLNCSLEETRLRYHCLPDSGLTTLYEFCYDNVRPLVQGGFCVVLDINSLQLDDYNCSSFTDGCPSTYYDSDKLYKYPRCLDIDFQIHCFQGEKNCAEQRLKILTTDTNLTDNDTTTPLQENIGRLKDRNENDIIIGVICTVVGLGILVIAIIYFLKFRRHENKRPPEVTTSTLNPYPITEGHTATLACSLTAANPRESINWSWVKPDQPDNVLKTGSTYSIPNIQRGQSGRYMCTATNSIGTSEPVTIEIDVQYKPEVCSTCTTQGSYKIIEGQTATFICQLIAANPNTGVTWRWFKADLPSNILHSGPTFTLTNIQREQSGTYWCTASNIIGISDPVTIHVDVQDIPAITIQGDLEIVCGETACVEAEIQQTHNWSTTWYRVTGDNLKQIDSNTTKYAKTTTRQLVIQRVSKDDQGEYQAIITGNPYGQYLKVPSEVFILKILGERPILQKLEASFEKEGINFHYEYEVSQESPKANYITWTRNGETLIIDHNKYIGGDIKNNSLTIKFPTMQDIGEYTCTISNAVGAVSKSLIIDEDLLIGRWARTLKLANIGKWNNLVGSPLNSDLERIKEALNNSDPPKEITEKLIENSREHNWPNGLHTRQKREENSKMFERFKTRKIKGMQAVVILSFENKHMPEDLIKKPGILITFCGGVK